MRVVPSACALAALIAGFGLYAEAQERRLIVSADQTQFAAIGPIKYLWLKLSIANHTDARVKMAAADVQLAVGEQKLSHGLPPQSKGMPARRFPGDPLGTLTYFSDGELPPDAEATGWICFDLSPLKIATDKLDVPASASWIIEARFGENAVEFDLKKHEKEVLNANLRASPSDATVHVIEIGRRMNLINIEELIKLVASLPSSEGGFIIKLTEPYCATDQWGVQCWHNWQARNKRTEMSPIIVQDPQITKDGTSGLFVHRYRATASEAAATAIVLGRRKGTGPTLLRYLFHDEAETRAAAAEALSTHLAEPAVFEALVSSARDKANVVRCAALRSLGDLKTEVPSGARNDDSAGTVVILQAMCDTEVTVRQAATTAAAAFNCRRMRAALSPMLDDPDSSVRIAACLSLGALKERSAADKLRALMATDDRRVKTAAINALQSMDALSVADAALAKLDGATPTFADFQVLAEARDRRAVPKLIVMLNEKDTSQRTLAARTLGEIGDREAVPALLQALEERTDLVLQTSAAEALAKFGVREAVEPIRMVKARWPNEFHVQLSCLRSLVRLEAPGAFEQLRDLLEHTENPGDIQQTLFALGESHRAEAIDMIAPYLDRELSCSAAAGALVSLSLPEIIPPFEKRLLDAHYPHGGRLLRALSRSGQWLKSPEGTALLEKATKSANEETKIAAARHGRRFL